MAETDGWLPKFLDEFRYYNSPELDRRLGIIALPKRSYIASDAVKKAMKKHGIHTLIQESPDSDLHYFMRNNKKIKINIPGEAKYAKGD